MWPFREGHDNMISLVHKKYGKGQNRLAYRTKRCLYGGGRGMYGVGISLCVWFRRAVWTAQVIKNILWSNEHYLCEHCEFSYCFPLKMSDTSTLSQLKISQVNVRLVWYLCFIKIMGGRSSGWAYCYDEGGYSKSWGLRGLYKLLGKERESGWVSAFNYCPRKKWGGEWLLRFKQPAVAWKGV